MKLMLARCIELVDGACRVHVFMGIQPTLPKVTPQEELFKRSSNKQIDWWNIHEHSLKGRLSHDIHILSILFLVQRVQWQWLQTLTVSVAKFKCPSSTGKGLLGYPR